MRPELALIEKIEQYLKGELTGADKAAFEKQMANDPSLQEEIKLQQDVMKGIERTRLKTQIQAARKGFNAGKNFTKWGLGGLSIVAIVIAAFLLYKNMAHNNALENQLPEYNEKGEKLWADADRNIAAQTFQVDINKDTAIETKGGIVMAVPAHGFLDENGNPADGKIDLIVKEALDPQTIMNAGLSTRSGNDLLESGGMFYIDARKDGKSLKIDPANGIYTEVPANEIKEGMRLFTGKRMPDGSIDWIDPKPLERDLMPVDISTLNFYPPLYLDSLHQWGYDTKNKHFTDSLYYSFAALFESLPKTDTSVGVNEYVGPQSYPISKTGDTGYVHSDSADKVITNTDTHFYDIFSIHCGINPAKIKAIWNEKFQNTLLATREFEERLRVIHILNKPTILDLYVKNLDKPLYYIDSLADLLTPRLDDSRRPFHLFALRNDGKVKNGSRQFAMLKNYYDNKTKAFTEAIAKTQNEFWAKQADLDNEATDKKDLHQTDSLIRITNNFEEEFELNLKEAYRQLGKSTSIVYRTQVTATGWNNVDKYVYESTVNRTTLDYTDPETGKKAVIKYLPFTVQVEQWKEYDHLYVYLLPDKLSSFMRINGSDGKFAEKLDELMQYQLVCVGYKDEQAYYYSQQTVISKDYTGIELIAISKEDLDAKLGSVGSLNQSPALLKETDYFLYDIKDQKRKKQNLVIQELRSKTIRLIFPCYEEIKSETDYAPPSSK